MYTPASSVSVPMRGKELSRPIAVLIAAPTATAAVALSSAMCARISFVSARAVAVYRTLMHRTERTSCPPPRRKQSDRDGCRRRYGPALRALRRSGDKCRGAGSAFRQATLQVQLALRPATPLLVE